MSRTGRLLLAIAALAGIVEASRQFSASNALGGGTLQLNAIAAAVIGGTSLFGGRGRVHQAILGALGRLGYTGVTGVRQGKHFELDVAESASV